MCRLLGIVSSEPTDFKIVLREAPLSMAALSKEHRDGWGIAVFDDEARGWCVEKGVACASEDARFHQLAVGSRGELMVAHIRQKTVGETSLANTHPFERGRWVFAHNGTAKDVGWLRKSSSRERLAEIGGETDSELLFAWVLTRLDEAGVASQPASDATDRALGAATRTARDKTGFGAFNFLLSDGTTTYAHRLGRTLHLLDRGPRDEVRTRRRAHDGTVFETPWSPRRLAVFVASERMTDEPWQHIEEGTLLRIDRVPVPHWRLVAA
ncbi:MAG TPA: class II glutamine amidotransferase [Polyangiaceae bacterium]|nr:class II glutamine amidotransferase [Polyangiaceae bacterium]